MASGPSVEGQIPQALRPKSDFLAKGVVMARKDTIEKALGSVYSRDGKTRGTMVDACAEHLDKNWDKYLADVERGRYDDMAHAIHLQIWNWFPGGGTAEIAANEVMEAMSEVSTN